MGFRIENVEFKDGYKALLGVMYKLLQNPGQLAIIRVPDEDAANQMSAMIQDAVDRIKIEFDSSEKGPNPLIPIGQLVDSSGKVIFKPDYGQTAHQDMSILKD